MRVNEKRLGEMDPILRFDESLARTYFPRPFTKYARIVERNPDQESIIDTEWGGKQRFIGTYVEVYDPYTKTVNYGSAYKEWVATNSRVPDIEDGWCKSSPVRAYKSPSAGWAVTVLADGTEETRKWVNEGDWLVRQRFGELMCIDAEKFPLLYDLESAANDLK